MPSENDFAPAHSERRRPTYTTELAEAICERVASGLSLRKACAELQIGESCVRKWVIADHQGFGAQYARAREMQFESWADEIKELSDECREGVVVTRETDAKGRVKTTTSRSSDMIERAKLQIDARKWLLSKLGHKRYGDRIESVIEVGGTGRPILIEIDPNRNHRRMMSVHGEEEEAPNGTNGNSHH